MSALKSLFSSPPKLSPTSLVLITATVASSVSVLATLAVQSQLNRIKRKKLEFDVENDLKQNDIKPIKLNEYGVPISEEEEESSSNTATPSAQEEKEPIHKAPLFGGSASLTSSLDTLTETDGEQKIEYDQELIDEQLARNRVFLGEEGLKKVRNTFVVVVGAGGVGSWVATMLVRSGIRKLRIIDFDQVTLSSLNRHATAELADVGKSKVHCIADHLKKIAPWVIIEPVVALWDVQTEIEKNLIGEGEPDWIVDAIDNINTKVDLLHYCYENLVNHDLEVTVSKKQKKRELKNNPIITQNNSKLKKTARLISAMGAGAKSDPTRVSIADISCSLEDPLARSTRYRLKHRNVFTGIPVVFSTEKPSEQKAKLQPLPDEIYFEQKGKEEAEKKQEKSQDVDEYAVLPDFRVRILPVLGPLPAIFGLTIATHILTITAGYPGVTDPTQGGYSLAGKRRHKLYDTALQTLAGQMARLNWLTPEGDNSHQSKKFGTDGIPGMPINVLDVEYLIEEVFRGKSVVSGEASRLAISMWNPIKDGEKKEAKFNNLVVMTKDEQLKHEENVLIPKIDPKDYYPESVIKVVEARMRERDYYEQFR